MKKFLPLIILLLMLVLTVGGTVWVVLTYPHRASASVGKYSLSQTKIRELKKQVLLFNQKRKFRESENLLRRIVADYPGNVLASVMLGKVKYLRGNYRESGQIFRRLSVIYADNPLIRNNLGAVLVTEGLYESGIRELNAAEKLSRGARYVYINLWQASVLLGDMNKAQYYWEKARKSFPSLPEEAILLMTDAERQQQ